MERAGADPWLLANVIDQLASYCGTREATEKDIREFTQNSFDENIFHFTDALGARDTKRALELLFDQLQSGSHPLYILTMLIRQFRLLLAASLHPTAGAEEFGAHPFAFRKAKEESRKFSQ
jgi:DNA polymerase-3 subunit delta